MPSTSSKLVRRATTLSTLARALVQALEAKGLDTGSLLQQAQLDPILINTPGARVPMEAMTRLWTLAIEETGNPALGLEAARFIQPASNHALGLAWLASTTLREALERLERFHRVLSTGMSMRLHQSREPLELLVEPADSDVLMAKEAIEAFFTITVTKCRMLMGDEYAPAAVYLMRQDPGLNDVYRQALGVDPQFSSTVNAIFFHGARLDDPLPAGDPELAAELDNISERYLSTIDPKAFTHSVRDILEDILPSGRPTLGSVARLMNRGVKTVQRGLKSEGTSFQQVLEQTRMSLAVTYLREPDLSLTHVAHLLGFSDQSNFTRAFKRWTHQSPGSYRATRADHAIS